MIDNRPARADDRGGPVARSTPDGHTLMYVLPNFTISSALQSSLPYDPVKDFVAITQIGMSTNVLVAAPALGAKTVKDFIALAKAQPGKFIFASSAVGSASHLTGARFNLIAGIKVVKVAFKGGRTRRSRSSAGAPTATSAPWASCCRSSRREAGGLGVTTPQRAPYCPMCPRWAS